jgi:hypothetical protein
MTGQRDDPTSGTTDLGLLGNRRNISNQQESRCQDRCAAFHGFMTVMTPFMRRQ